MSFVHRNTTTLYIELKKKSIKLCFTSASQVSKKSVPYMLVCRNTFTFESV